MSLFSNEALEHMRDCASQYATGVHQLITGVLWLEKEQTALQASHEELLTALNLILDSADYRRGACRINEMIAAVLPDEILTRAREAINHAKQVK